MSVGKQLSVSEEELSVSVVGCQWDFYSLTVT